MKSMVFNVQNVSLHASSSASTTKASNGHNSVNLCGSFGMWVTYDSEQHATCPNALPLHSINLSR